MYIKSNSHLRRNVSFINGSPLSNDDLINMAQAQSPNLEACFILSDSGNASKNHTKHTLAQALAISRTIDRTDNVFLLLGHPGSRSLTDSMQLNRQTVFGIEVKLNLLATSCIAPGFTTLFYNLLKTRNVAIDGLDGSEDNEWLAEYEEGASKELYCVRLAQDATHG